MLCEEQRQREDKKEVPWIEHPQARIGYHGSPAANYHCYIQSSVFSLCCNAQKSHRQGRKEQRPASQCVGTDIIGASYCNKSEEHEYLNNSLTPADKYSMSDSSDYHISQDHHYQRFHKEKGSEAIIQHGKAISYRKGQTDASPCLFCFLI